MVLSQARDSHGSVMARIVRRGLTAVCAAAMIVGIAGCGSTQTQVVTLDFSNSSLKQQINLRKWLRNSRHRTLEFVLM